MIESTPDTTDPREYPALEDFNDGFLAGYRGEPKAKGRSATYNNAHAKGVAAKRRVT